MGLRNPGGRASKWPGQSGWIAWLVYQRATRTAALRTSHSERPIRSHCPKVRDYVFERYWYHHIDNMILSIPFSSRQFPGIICSLPNVRNHLETNNCIDYFMNTFQWNDSTHRPCRNRCLSIRYGRLRFAVKPQLAGSCSAARASIALLLRVLEP